MKKHLSRLAVTLVLAIAGVVVFYSLPHEPRYEGKLLSYWIRHINRGVYGGQPLQNAEAVVAVREMGKDALPFLVKWVGNPTRFRSDQGYTSGAMDAFRSLGPAAMPAIPGLIALLGKENGNYPSVALASIGSNSVPALIEALETNHNVRAQMAAMWALSYMGTNAEAAVPVLTGFLSNTNARLASESAGTLGIVGRNQPRAIVPALAAVLTNSSAHARATAAESLGIFGPAAISAIPELLATMRDEEAYVRIRAAVALKQVSPARTDALGPLIQNLTNRDISMRQQTLLALETLGTNGAPVLPAVVKHSLVDTFPDNRTIAMRWIGQLDQVPDSAIAAIAKNTIYTNSNVSDQAVGTLGKFCDRSKPAFVALLRAMQESPNLYARQQAGTILELTSHRDPSLLIECLNHDESNIRYHAILILYRMQKRVSEAVPLLRKALHDRDPAVRSVATNCLIQIDPLAAKDEGVKLPAPYSRVE